MSLLCVIIFAFTFYDRLMAIQPNSSETMQVMTDIMDEDRGPIDLLGELQYMFAISNIDARIGRVEVSQVTWPSKGEHRRESIPMVQCTELLKDDDPILDAIESNLMRTDDVFLCPNSTSLVVQGNYGTEEFKYVQIVVKGCDLEDGSCYSGTELDESINNLAISFLSMKSHVDFS